MIEIFWKKVLCIKKNIKTNALAINVLISMGASSSGNSKTPFVIIVFMDI